MENCMENYYIILGFLQCLGIEELMGCAWPTGKIKVIDCGIIAVIITGLFDKEARICKDAFEDAILANTGCEIEKYHFDRKDVEQRYTEAKQAATDATGTDQQQKLAGKEYGARIALSLIDQRMQ